MSDRTILIIQHIDMHLNKVDVNIEFENGILRPSGGRQEKGEREAKQFHRHQSNTGAHCKERFHRSTLVFLCFRHSIIDGRMDKKTTTAMTRCRYRSIPGIVRPRPNPRRLVLKTQSAPPMML